MATTEAQIYIQIFDRLSPFLIGMDAKLRILDETMQKIRPILLQEIKRLEMKRIHTQYRQRRKGRW